MRVDKDFSLALAIKTQTVIEGIMKGLYSKKIKDVEKIALPGITIFRVRRP